MEDLERIPPVTLEKAIPRLYEILFESNLLRQIEEEDEIAAAETVVDVGFGRLAVNKEQAETVRQEVREILALYPGTIYPDLPPLKSGPSYIHVGAALDSQNTALCLFALGEALNFWRVITPKRLYSDIVGSEISEAEASELAGKGLVMIDGYRPI